MPTASSAPLRIGRIPFLVCAPFFHRSYEPNPDWEFTDGPPSLLNRALSEGRVDLAPGSCLEYARGYPDYRLLPGFSTSGRQEVKSSLLLSRVAWEGLSGHRVRLCADSATSNALFRVISRFRYRVEPLCLEPELGGDAPAEAAGPALDAQVLIGDPALREAARGRWPFVYDLAEAWTRWQGTPFAFGLWMVRKEEAESHPDRLRRYHGHLAAAVSEFRREPELCLRRWAEHVPLPLPLPEALAFFASADYGWNPGLGHSLKGFFAFAGSLGLCHPDPELRWAF